MVFLSYEFTETPQALARAAGYVLGGVVLVLVAFLLAYLLFAPRRADDQPKFHLTPRTADETSAALWHGRVAAILKRFETGEIDDEQAYLDLATVSRGYAAVRLRQSPKDTASLTLTDMRRMDVAPKNREGMQALRQTVTALYPPEFASPMSNENARRATVPQACEWVDSLIERWH